ncbi:carbamoyltransferase C-terminal domain-containing protein [uncultured Microscilla sp.]|uniref:carbamoyltransferase C-terminal domain-containing protein n=1 Tax=uncultured Microscilla sp. TaxID=432653 RepID=UPI002613FEF2|nr:carbamoyltransferase C-terminal domain-containing protein [uncultured Microscilla sp.]
MKILGVHDGHNASVCLTIDGKIEYLIQEERIAREKNMAGFPESSLRLVLEKSGLTPNDIDIVGLNGDYMPKPTNRQGTLDYYKSLIGKGKGISISKVKNKLKSVKAIAAPYEELNKSQRIKKLVDFGFSQDKIEFVNHHLTHAASAYFGNANLDDKVLVLTNDGAGDRVCATVNIGEKGEITKLSDVHENHSIGLMYAIFTFLTGMVPLEHEYKLMGMAPYADKKGTRKVADQLWDMFELSEDGTKWEFTKGYSMYGSLDFFHEFMFLKRFDHLMGGLQLFIEEFLVKWVTACIKKTGIKKVALAGGTFMNVKANKLLMEIPEIETIFVTPSAGDESNPIGICYYLSTKHQGVQAVKPFDSIYFGISFSNDEIQQAFDTYSFKHQYSISKEENIEKKSAEILAKGSVIARFKGREEFGARSLGNRAIIANPNVPDVVKEINSMIKNRDFWMPFASSIIDDDMDKYLSWKKDKDKNAPYYMIMTYDTNPIAHTELAGGIHPYDKTVRPQMVTKEHNQDYWNLINEFKKITNIGGVLNTSLNLHGLPLVHAPEDAFHVMENSSLKYLAIGDFLITKQA